MRLPLPSVTYENVQQVPLAQSVIDSQLSLFARHGLHTMLLPV
jgi:hypothetical protein